MEDSLWVIHKGLLNTCTILRGAVIVDLALVNSCALLLVLYTEANHKRNDCIVRIAKALFLSCTGFGFLFILLGLLLLFGLLAFFC